MTIEANLEARSAPGGEMVYMDLVRGVAAQLVVVGHSISVFLPSIYMVPAPGGGWQGGADGIYVQNLAVLIFFYISGFLVTGSFLNKLRRADWRLTDFLLDRFARIFTPLVPLLLILFVTDNLVYGDGARTSYTIVDAGLDDLVRNVFMLYDNPAMGIAGRALSLPLAGSAFGTADQLWTVVIEWWIYVLFGLVAFWVAGRRSAPPVWIVAFLGALVVPLATALTATGLIVAWALGMCARLFERRLRAQGKARLKFIALVALALFAWRWIGVRFDFYDGVASLLLGITLFAYVLSHNIGTLPRLLRTAVDYMSKTSYSLYLVHLSLIFYLAHWWPRLIGSPVALLIAWPVCNLVAFGFYLAFERHYPRVRRALDQRRGHPARAVARSASS